MNIYNALLNTIANFPDRTAIRLGTDEWIFKDVQLQVEAVAIHLGDQRGKHLALLGGNSISFVSGIFGIFAAGGVAVPLNAMLTPAELLPQINHADISLLLYTAALRPLVKKLLAAGLTLPTLCVEDDILAATSPTSNLPTNFPGQATDPQALAMIIYTSGTTAEPKGVMLSQRNLLSNHESFAAQFGFSAADCMLTVLPLFHSFAFTVQLLSLACLGCKVVLYESFSPKEILRDFRREERIVFAGVPPMYAVLARLYPPKLRSTARLRYLISGGGPLPRQVQQDFQKRAGVEIIEGYGLTEAAPVVSCNLPAEANRPGTIGRALRGIEALVWDAEGKELPPGQEGELVVRGANVMLGYYKNSAATAQALPGEGWLKTGDFAVIDAEGYIRISGRAKELIVMAGENIHPREVEEALVEHPAVFEAAVVGVPDRRKTEVPKAFIAPTPGVAVDSISVAAVRDFLQGKLARHKIPAHWEVLSVLPKNPTGKIDKKCLK